MPEDRVTAALEEIRARARWASSADEIAAPGATAIGSAKDVPRLIAAVERVLARHKPGDKGSEIHTLDKGWHSVTACAGCEEPWPCPDYEDISREIITLNDGTAPAGEGP
jgi:hypothetical protein